MPRKKPQETKFTEDEYLTARFRLEFIKYVEILEPKVAADLAALIPTYRALSNGWSVDFVEAWLNGSWEIGGKNEQDCRSRVLYWLESDKRFDLAESSEHEIEKQQEKALSLFWKLRDGYEMFLQKFGLTSLWLREGLFETLKFHSRLSMDSVGLSNGIVHSFATISTEDFVFSFRGWRPEESWQGFSRELKREFESQLNLYKKLAKTEFMCAGLTKATKPHRIEDVKYLVMWTVQGLSKENIIARHVNVDRGMAYSVPALNKRFRELREYYDLPVRKAR